MLAAIDIWLLPRRLLVEMLRLASREERRRVAARLAPLAELPNSVARILLRDEVEIAGPLIEQCASLSDADIVGCARDASFEHRLLIAARRGLSEIVTETLFAFGEMAVMEAVLRNASARLSQDKAISTSVDCLALLMGSLVKPLKKGSTSSMAKRPFRLRSSSISFSPSRPTARGPRFRPSSQAWAS